MKNLVALLLASSLAGCSNGPGGEPPGPIPNAYPGSDGVPVGTAVLCDRPLPRQQLYTAPILGAQILGATPLQTVYHATLPNGSLVCGYWDAIHSPPQPLKPGGNQLAGTTDIIHAPAGDSAFKLGLTAPSHIDVDPITNFPKDTSSVGLFSTAVSFGPGAVFSLRVTFQNPCGPHLAPVSGGLSNAWAVSIAASEGDERDLGTDRRLWVTFRIKGKGATLNVWETGTDEPLKADTVNPAIYKAIFGDPETCGTGHKPFTLTLYVNRATGSGVASLAGPALEVAMSQDRNVKPLDLPFNMHLFGTSGPVIETVGTTLANCCSEGAPISVEVTDFQIKQLLRSPFGPFEPNVPNPPPINPY
jgi:hypothetical protein